MPIIKGILKNNKWGALDFKLDASYISENAFRII